MTTISDSSTSTKNKKRALVVGALAGAIAISGTFAFFTDRVSTSVSATAGTVDATLDASWADIGNFNPGDIADLSYSISNDGNKSVDIRERLVVKSAVAMDASEQAEFEIYKASDVEQDAAGAYVPKSNATPVATGEDRVVSADNKAITYALEEYTLNGTGDNAETETGVATNEHSTEYVLVFKGESDNDFQGANVTVDLVAEAKQHRNTNADTWSAIASEQLTVGDQTIAVVPER